MSISAPLALAVPPACALSCAAPTSRADTLPAFRNTALAPEERASDLLSRVTLQEKAEQMQDNALAIEWLGLKRYGWWNEVLHGVARAGNATVFPDSPC
jgi:beta-glucosidase